MEETLARLVAIPTVTDDVAANEAALDYIDQYLSERGMYVKRYNFQGRGSLVATPRPQTKRVKILLYAHTDVVAAPTTLFKLRREGGKIYGRGVFDMKFAIAGYLQVVDELQDQLQDYDFAIMITTDEEYGDHGGINGIPHLLGEGYRGEVCILPDGGRAWDIEAVAKGVWRFELTAVGRSAHGSRPWEGDSASVRLIEALHDLQRDFKDQGLDTDTLNIGQIQGNGTYNQVPSRATAQIEMRLAADSSHANRRARMMELCDTYRLNIEAESFRELARQDVDNPLIRGFMDSITRTTGHISKGCVSCAASDAPHFNAVGIPCAITYLPGGEHHGEHEWVDREALLQFPEVIRDYLERHGRLQAPQAAAQRLVGAAV